MFPSDPVFLRGEANLTSFMLVSSFSRVSGQRFMSCSFPETAEEVGVFTGETTVNNLLHQNH